MVGSCGGNDEAGNAMFGGVRFFLSGFDRAEECQFVDALEKRGASNVGQYSSACTHIIVSQHTYDDPICAAARKDGKVLVTKCWVDESLERNALQDANNVRYIPVRDRAGIPGAKNICICLTGYQSSSRQEIEKMVAMMGAVFMKPLDPRKVTHLVCHKFEGDKYDLAVCVKLKLVNHRWLEDCLRTWSIVDESGYSISGHELELAEAQAQKAQKTEQREEERTAPVTVPDTTEPKEKMEPEKTEPELIQKEEGLESRRRLESPSKVPPEEIAETYRDFLDEGLRTIEDEHDVDSDATTQMCEREDDNVEEVMSKSNGSAKTNSDAQRLDEKRMTSSETRRNTSTGKAKKKRKSSDTSVGHDEIVEGSTFKRGKHPTISTSPTRNGGQQSSSKSSGGSGKRSCSEKDRNSPSSAKGSLSAQNSIADSLTAGSDGKLKGAEDQPMKAQKPADVIRIDDASEDEKEVQALRKGSKEELVKRRRGRPKQILADPKNYRFALSGHTDEKKKYKLIIRKLHGHVCRDDHSWKEQATHCVMTSPLRRTEKLFAALASGRWILKFEYLDACSKAGRFVQEAPYEWYEPGTITHGTIDLEAPRKWRLAKGETGCGAFEGLRIIIYGDCILPSTDTLKRAIKAGGGAVVAVAPPYSTPLASGVDFAIISAGIPHDDPRVAEILRRKVACVSDEFFVEFVCNPSACRKKYVLYNTDAAVDAALRKLDTIKQHSCRRHSSSSRSDDEEDRVNSGGGAAAAAEELVDRACNVCKRKDREEVMLFCDGSACEAATHTFCLDPPLDEVPTGDWYCRRCSS